MEQQVQCDVCPVFNKSDWCVLAHRELSILSGSRSRREYKPREIIYSSSERNEGIHCISGGVVGVRKTDEQDNSVLLHLAYPGDTLGYRSFLTKGEHGTTAVAMETSVVCFVARKAVSKVLGENPGLGLQFLRHAATDLEMARNTILRNATFSTRTRFIHILLVLMRRRAKKATDGSRILRLPLSRRDLASMVGARHETLSRIISDLENGGIAMFSGRSVCVPDAEALANEIHQHFFS
jgi:CRP/FNR family transcriptional regulator